MQMTSYLHHNLIFMKGGYSENFVKILLGDVILRHVTSFYRFLAKNCQKVMKNCWRQQKLPNMRLPFIICSKEHYISFHLRGQPSFHDKWFNFYRLWRERPDFRRFLLIFADVIGKVLTSAKKWWLHDKSWYCKQTPLGYFTIEVSFMSHP